jgi:hypothetical protein
MIRKSSAFLIEICKKGETDSRFFDKNSIVEGYESKYIA